MKGTKEIKLYMWLTRRIPRKFLYWIALRIGAIVTTGKYGNTIVSELTFMEALDRIEVKEGGK